MDGWVRRETGSRFALDIRRLWGFPDDYIRAIIMLVPLLQILRYLAKSPDTWFALYELANWALARAAHKLTYPQLF
jgi:hypothetical protein